MLKKEEVRKNLRKQEQDEVESAAGVGTLGNIQHILSFRNPDPQLFRIHCFLSALVHFASTVVGSCVITAHKSYHQYKSL